MPRKNNDFVGRANALSALFSVFSSGRHCDRHAGDARSRRIGSVRPGNALHRRDVSRPSRAHPLPRPQAAPEGPHPFRASWPQAACRDGVFSDGRSAKISCPPSSRRERPAAMRWPGRRSCLETRAVSPPASAVPTLSCAASLASKRPRRTQDPDIPSLTRWCNFRYSSYTYCARTSNWLQGSPHEPGTLFGTGVALDSPHDLRCLSDGGQLGSVP